jgi:hypothetical protein
VARIELNQQDCVDDKYDDVIRLLGKCVYSVSPPVIIALLYFCSVGRRHVHVGALQ